MVEQSPWNDATNVQLSSAVAEHVITVDQIEPGCGAKTQESEEAGRTAKRDLLGKVLR